MKDEYQQRRRIFLRGRAAKLPSNNANTQRRMPGVFDVLEVAAGLSCSERSCEDSEYARLCAARFIMSDGKATLYTFDLGVSRIAQAMQK